MDYAKTINITCKPEILESYFFKRMLDEGNNSFASEMGIHPTASSREKNRIFKLACKAIAHYGLPAEAVSMPEKSRSVVIEGDYAEQIIKVLEYNGKLKRKTSKAATDEAQMELI
ncbi:MULTISPECIES: hypothetical protein [Providencia]|uniref:hypothetical protein n=1 Tax=Providencia TaxID=586 RepID=UPI0005675D00|nr:MULTISPECIES: hypothetical protein [Providencia]